MTYTCYSYPGRNRGNLLYLRTNEEGKLDSTGFVPSVINLFDGYAFQDQLNSSCIEIEFHSDGVFKSGMSLSANSEEIEVLLQGEGFRLDMATLVHLTREEAKELARRHSLTLSFY